MRDMKEKYGAEVQSFPYAFVIPSHAPGWDEPLRQAPEPAALPSGRAAPKTPTYIEVKPRPA
jgi:hypothetical protein